MNIAQPLPWPTRLSQAIVGFPLWGRLRPHTSRGHAITALAFHAWAKGGLGLFLYNTQTKTGGRHLYATAFSPSRFDPLLVDWEKGWCSTERESSKRFQADASRHGSVYAWSGGPLSREQAGNELAGLSQQDQALVLAMQMHLDTELGAFDWDVWKNAGILAVQPTALADGSYLLPSKDPLRTSGEWPDQLDADALCQYLSAYPRSGTEDVDFFYFQERLDGYMKSNPVCAWTAAHSQRLLDRFAGPRALGGATRASHYFNTHDFEKIWPMGCTRVLAPHFSDYLQSFVAEESRTTLGQTDVAWFAASHAVVNSKEFDMYEHVFQGKAVLDGTELLSLAGVDFGIAAHRGERGVLLRIDTNQGEGPVLDALRQARAYCGGILAVDNAVVVQNPMFWQGVFARREVAALLDERQHPVCEHPHFSYAKRPAVLSYPSAGENLHTIAEYSLFQENARQYRGSMYSSVQGRWGWKHILDCVGAKHDWCPTFPFSDAQTSYEKNDTWMDIRERWFETMAPNAAALVLNKLAQRPDWPVDLESEARDIADHYLAGTPMHAVCEMMEFEASGVLAALHQYQRGLTPNEEMSIDTDSFSNALGDGP